jgi:general secretion pathway protein J
MSRNTSRPDGFTLIEVLIAIAIFALMAGVAYRGLTAILETRQRVDAENEKWRNIGLLFTRLERDLAVAVPRPIRDAAKPYADALAGETVIVGEYGAQLAFTRMGSPDDTGVMGAPQRVGYRIKNNNVEVLLWPVLDQAPRTVPEPNIIATDISDMTFRYLDNNQQWQSRWPPAGNYPTGSHLLPNAVEVSITLTSGEIITRLIDLPTTGQAG